MLPAAALGKPGTETRGRLAPAVLNASSSPPACYIS